MKKYILILTIAIVAMFSSVQAEEEILWKSRYNMIIDKNGDIDPGYIYNAIFTPDDKFIVLSCEFKTFLIESETGKYFKDIPVSGVIRFSNDGKYIYTYDNKKFNYETGELVGEFLNKGEKSPKFTNMDICEKAGVMVGTTNEAKPTESSKNIWIYDLATMELSERIGDPYTAYGHLFVAQDGSIINTYGDYYAPVNPPQLPEFKNEIWDLKLRKKLFNSNSRNLEAIQVSPDGRWLGNGKGGLVTIFDTKKYEKKWEMTQGGGGALTGIAFSPDSKYLATGENGSSDILNDLHIWNVETGKLSYRYSNSTMNKFSKENYSFSNNGKLILGFGQLGVYILNAIYTTTKVDPIVNNDTILISPNPVTSKVSVNINQPYNAKLFSQTGNEIDLTSISFFNSSKYEIDVRSLQAGSYYLIINQNNIPKLYKIIKE